MKEMRKKRKRKKIKKEKARLAAESKRSAKTKETVGSSSVPRLTRHQRKVLKKGITAAVIAVAVIAAVFYIQTRTYSDYKILYTSEQEDIISTKYT